MRKMRATGIIIVLLLVGITAKAQESLYSVSLFGTFTTSSKLFHHPNDPDALLRASYLPIDGIFSAGVDVRRALEPLSLQVGLGIEYISKVSSDNVIAANGKTVSVENGYTVVPIELSGYFQIPIGTKSLHFFMGGGGGIYLGKRIYRYAGADAPAVSTQPGYGIHILSGAEVGLSSRWSARGELKFRDVQFESVNQFNASSVSANGSVIPLDQQPADSRINIDGMTINVGIVYHF